LSCFAVLLKSSWDPVIYTCYSEVVFVGDLMDPHHLVVRLTAGVCPGQGLRGRGNDLLSMASHHL